MISTLNRFAAATHAQRSSIHYGSGDVSDFRPVLHKTCHVMTSQLRFAQESSPDLHVHGPDCNHSDRPAMPKELLKKIQWMLMSIPLWFKEFFGGLLTDIKQIFHGPQETELHSDHDGHDHSSHEGHNH